MPKAPTIPTDGRAHKPAVQGVESKQPRRVLRPETTEVKELSAHVLNNDAGSANSPGGAVQNGASGPVSAGDEVQGTEVPGSPEGGEDAQAGFSTLEAITSSPASDADSEIIDSRTEQTDQTVTRVTTTTTAREVAVQPRKDVSTTVSRTTTGHQRVDIHSSGQGTLQKKASFHRETHYPTVTETFSTTSRAIEPRRIMVPSKFHRSIREEFVELERLHREEKDRIVALMNHMSAEYEDYKHLSEGQLEDLQTENENLQREIASSVSRITLLEIQLESRGYESGTPSLPEQVESNITTITTTITTITTTITAISTKVEQWKRTVGRNQGQITIPNRELDQILLNLSDTASQMTELQRRYAKLSGDYSSVRHELQAISSLRDEKDRTIASLNAEIAAAGRNNETLRHDLSAASSQRAELQKRYDAQFSELTSVHNELQASASLVKEKDRTIASSNAEVARWKQSDTTKVEQIANARRDHEKCQRDLSAATSQNTELQKHFDAQSKEFSAIQKDLQAHKSLVEEKQRAVTTLTAELEQRKRTDVTTAEQFAAEHKAKEELQQDLEAFSRQVTDLQKRYATQSEEITSVRKELQDKVSLLEQKEHAVSSLNTEIAQVKREEKVKAEQITTARKEVEQLRRELSSSSSQLADLQKRYETQSKELTIVRDELHKIEVLYQDGSDQGPGGPSKHAVSEYIARALEKKTKEMEELRQEIATYTTRNTELQKKYETLSREVSTLRDKLKVEGSRNEGTVASLTAQIEQLKRADTAKAEQIATLLNQVDKLQQDLSTSTSQYTELQGRYETQSRDLISVRRELQASTSTNEGKDRTIATLTADLNQWKQADTNKAEEIATIRKQVEKLQRDLSASASKLEELRGRYDAQLRELDSARSEVQTNISLHETKDRTITTLTQEVERWKHADSMKTEQIASTMEQVEKLRRDASASASNLAEIRGRYEALSRDLITARSELQAAITSNGDKDRTITTLAAEVEKWKRADASKEERITTIQKQAEDLQRDLTKSTSQVTDLQERYDKQSKELSSLRDQLQDTASGKDRAVASLISQVEKLEKSDAAKREEIIAAGRDIDQLRGDLAVSSSRITEFTSQIESWKRLDTTKAEELTATLKDLDQLRRDLSTASSHITEYKDLHARQSAEFTSQTEELTEARQKLELLQRDLSTSSSRIIEFQQRYEVQSAELSSLQEQLRTMSGKEGEKDRTITTLTTQIEQWKLADVAKAEELVRARRDLDQLRPKLDDSLAKIAELQKLHADDALKISSPVSEERRRFYKQITTEVKDYTSVINLTTTIDKWLRADTKRADELALELAQRNKENEELRHHLVTLKEIYISAPELKEIFQSETVEIRSRYEEQLETLRSTLVDRQSQLDGVQRFVTTADTYADAMIIQMLQKLNAEVQQTTTFMAECVAEDFKPRTAKPTKEQSSAMQRVSDYIGHTLAGSLGAQEHDDMALFLAIAFQAHITYYLRSLISSWTLERGYNDLISKTYEELQKSEAQTISGRWRALTRTYITPASMSDRKSLVSITVTGLSDIVVVASCAPTLSAAKSKLSTKFADKVSSIISIAGQFSKMIGEVVSADFEVLAIRPSQAFEETTMEEDVDDYDKDEEIPGVSAGEKVLCSTQLGMTKRMQLDSEKSSTLTVMKAKVVLESFLEG